MNDNDNIHCPKDDLVSVSNALQIFDKELNGKHVFITGSTGFFGKWILSSLIFYREKFNTDFKITALTRNRQNLFNLAESVEVLECDVCDHAKLLNSDLSNIDYLIHGATPADPKLNRDSPIQMLNTIVKGTENILNLAVEKKCAKFLNISSGAIYGPEMSHFSPTKENLLTGPSPVDLSSAYGEGKRISEFMGRAICEENGIHYSVARCFAFLGPYMAMDRSFAAGNFIGKVLSNQNIDLTGDGSPLRSFMYPSDLVIWLITILFKSENGHAYNVGSNCSVSIKEFAERIIKVSKKESKLNLATTNFESGTSNKYVPDTSKSSSLGLNITVDLDQAIQKTIAFYARQ